MNSKIVDIGINLLENPNKKKKEIAFFNLNDQSNETEKIIPEEFICPLSKKIMKEPVNIFDGSVFEKENILSLLIAYGANVIVPDKYLELIQLLISQFLPLS